MAKVTSEDPASGLPEPGQLGRYAGDLDLCLDVESLSTGDRIELARRAEEAALGADPEDSKLRGRNAGSRRVRGRWPTPTRWASQEVTVGYSHLDWLLPLLPECHHYCEAFAGSGAVLLNRDPSPVETFNDLDGEVVNFFRVLRQEKEQLVEAIGLTPFAREEFALACEISPDLSALERARRFYVRARQVRTGLAQTASIGRWANCKNNNTRTGNSSICNQCATDHAPLQAPSDQLERRPVKSSG